VTTVQSRRPERANRLAREKSPYLLQHAHNPVDWYAWEEAAFRRAREDNKPIFLSIGYSTCHWCHVMERESFENEQLAAFLNEHFISIKVDREERPDVDRIYMAFVQATTGQGGWPLNVFLTPERKPFFGGTYFPPQDHFGRPGFLKLLQHIHQLWTTRRGDLLNSAAELHAQLEQMGSTRPVAADADLTAHELRHGQSVFQAAYDSRHGGFGGAPKFPQPSVPRLLLRCARRFRDDSPLRMVLHTCERMAAGGIRDQLGGGFARYSVDAEWRVPHFEKMLYDNAQLTQLYLDAWLLSGDPQHAGVARDILAYIQRDMTHPQGGFYSAEDADSEGHEGKFYCWTRSEMQQLLAPDEFRLAERYFGVTEAGNFVDHSHPAPLPGQNVLSVVHPELTEAEKPLLAAAKQKLFAARRHRVRPHLDDKVLASWNGLMLGAFARAAAVLGDESYRTAAERNLAFLRAKLWEPAPTSASGQGSSGLSRGALYHRWRDGERDHTQLLTGYAFLLSGVIELYEATLEPAHLHFAILLADSMLARFYDPEHGGFFQSPADASDLILRVKEDHDGAEPAGGSVAVLALLKLGAISGREDFQAAARKSLSFFGPRLRQAPQALPCLLQALDFSLQEPVRVVVAGDPRTAKSLALLQSIHSVFQPNKVVLGNTGDVEAFAKSLPAAPGPLVYLCTGTACQAPTDDPGKLKEMLR
jgi:uncharacterized protein YyaL (SSP411 family)